MNANVHSIESFGTVDGPGTRFVIFLKGCNLRCLYCHNPDTWSPNGGKQFTVDQLLEKYEGVKEFVTGGITVSGGEPLMQIEFLIEFFKKCQEKKIHTCLDTSGGIFNPNNIDRMKKFDELIKHVDLVLLDLKHIDDKEHIKLTGISNVPILVFARYLSDNNVNVWIRHVVIPTITLDKNYLFKLGLFIKTLKNVKGLEALPYHT
ncbi:MAG: pyruvate formate-lyase-activating protein, partial [Mycoplasmatales bacterium]